MFAPGFLDELDDVGRQAWDSCVDERVRAAVARLRLDAWNRFVLGAPDERTPHRTVIDWPGLPVRPVDCLGRSDALPLLDWIPEGEGRVRSLQEEYVEWRVVRDGARILRVELTTELADYWRVLAGADPHRTLALVASFARRDQVRPEDVYGSCDPFALKTTPEERVTGFVTTMLAENDQSPYNDGRYAITCMSHRSNSLRALVLLTLAATVPRIARDRWSRTIRCLTCDELIPLLGGTAQLGRASDPVLVERLSRLAYEGRLVALDDPIGVYLQSAEWTRLRTADGDPVPPDWFTFSRGAGRGPDGIARWQRVVLEPPAHTGLAVSDLVDVATEERVTHGAQVADLVQVAVVLRVSDANAEDVGELEPSELSDALGDAARDCDGINERLVAYRQATA